MRKPKLTYQLIEQAVEMKSRGCTNADICQALGIAEQTFYRWLREGDTRLKRSLSEGIKKAEAEYKKTLLESIMSTATREKNPQWTAAAWLLERKYPDEYAQTTRRPEDGGDDAPRITLGVEVRVKEGGDE
ncbi:MAG: helix-turn-helix domain-containing protein [Atopobiaceae bacterium]|nr:helix-turn-helix domain-containing protein [Atopobiaceae bacterium]